MHTGKIKYTRRGSNPGWLRIGLAHGNFGFLCEYTRVELTKEEKGRVYFKVTDGYNCVGQEASLSKEHALQFLSDEGPQGAADVRVRYVGDPVNVFSPLRNEVRLQQWGELSAPGGITAKITLDSHVGKQYTPIPPGTHRILVPDNSHRRNGNTAGYASATPGMVGNDIWFPIGLSGSPSNSSRYIHVGHLSEGCVTVYELAKWAALYNYLISHRVPGSMGKYVGQLVVTK